MSMEFTLNDLQRQRVEDHLALVEQVLRRSIKTNETVDGMGHDDLYQEGCIALCRASVSYREEMGAFPAYARTVIRNYLLDRCREIQSARKNLPLVSLDAFAEMGVPEPVSPFHTEDLISDVSSSTLLSHFRNRYHGTARLGIKAMELRVRGYSCADIAKLHRSLHLTGGGKAAPGAARAGVLHRLHGTGSQECIRRKFVWQKKHFIRHWDISAAGTIRGGVIRSSSWITMSLEWTRRR